MSKNIEIGSLPVPIAEELLDYKILRETKDIATGLFKDKGIKYRDHAYFLAECYAEGYLRALVKNGYKVIVTRDTD